MVVLRVSLAAWLMWATSLEAQQTIYWKADHIYDPSGRVIAITTPISSDQTPPTAPTNLGYSDLNPWAVRLDWFASTDAGGSGLGGYKVFRGAEAIATVGPTVLFYRDDTIQPGNAYTYTVAAFDNAQNQSSPSNPAAFTSPTNSASDNFNRPDGPLGPDWSGFGGTSTIPVIRSNRAGTASAFTSNRTARYSGILFGSD